MQGDPLFLALLEKRLSGYRDSVRPGFSPKRYIANLGNSLQGDTWKRLTAAGSIKDPTLQIYDPKLAKGNGSSGMNALFPGKPQPYTTMSLPPLSPSSSMFDSSFHFYKNGMSTGAASMITLNSESEEYAPSSRALSPTESLNDRLSEVEILPQRKDQYKRLNAKQKEDLLSELLLEKTLNSDITDLVGWVTNNLTQGGGVEQDPASTLTFPKSKAKHRGGLKSGTLTSIPRLPPIQSAGVRPTTPAELSDNGTYQKELPIIAADKQNIDHSDKGGESNDILDSDAIHLDFTSMDESSFLADGRGSKGKQYRPMLVEFVHSLQGVYKKYALAMWNHFVFEYHKPVTPLHGSSFGIFRSAKRLRQLPAVTTTEQPILLTKSKINCPGCFP